MPSCILVFSVFLFFNSSCLHLSVCLSVCVCLCEKCEYLFPLSLFIHQKVSPFLPLSPPLTFYLKHTWHCARLCSLILQQYCIFLFLHFSHFIPAQESHLINSRAQSCTHHCMHTVTALRVCGYKCMLIALLIFSFMPSPLLSCEILSVCASISPFLSAFSALWHSSSVSYPSSSCVWPIAWSLFSLSTNHSTQLKPLNIPYSNKPTAIPSTAFALIDDIYNTLNGGVVYLLYFHPSG